MAVDELATEVAAPALASTPPRGSQLGPILLALVGGAVIFVLGTPYFELFESTNDSEVFNGAVTAALGALWFAVRRRDDGYSVVTSALFVAAAAMWVLVIGPFNWLITADAGTVEEAFQDKTAQFLCIVPVVLALSWAMGRSRQSLYLETGRPRRWLPFGTVAIVVGAVIVTLVAMADGADFSEVLDVAPWMLGFAAMNAFMEELWFRSVFLKPYVEKFGATVAIWVTAIVFGISHVEATYISDARQIPFALLVAALGALLAWTMRWGRSIWGAVLLHMALDFVVLFEFV